MLIPLSPILSGIWLAGCLGRLSQLVPTSKLSTLDSTKHALRRSKCHIRHFPRHLGRVSQPVVSDDLTRLVGFGAEFRNVQMVDPETTKRNPRSLFRTVGTSQ
jgi:hypothetical protein